MAAEKVVPVNTPLRLFAPLPGFGGGYDGAKGKHLRSEGHHLTLVPAPEPTAGEQGWEQEGLSLLSQACAALVSCSRSRDGMGIVRCGRPSWSGACSTRLPPPRGAGYCVRRRGRCTVRCLDRIVSGRPVSAVLCFVLCATNTKKSEGARLAGNPVVC